MNLGKQIIVTTFYYQQKQCSNKTIVPAKFRGLWYNYLFLFTGVLDERIFELSEAPIP